MKEERKDSNQYKFKVVKYRKLKRAAEYIVYACVWGGMVKDSKGGICVFKKA